MKRRSLNNKLASVIALLIPAIVFFDWLMNLGIMNLQIGLYLKGIATIIFFYIIKNNGSKTFLFKKTLVFFLTLFFAYSIVSDNTLENLYFSIRVAYWVFGAIAFYGLLRKGHFTNKNIRGMIVATAIIASVFTIILMGNSEEHQNASAYLLLWCLPLLLNFNRKKIVKFVIALAIIAIILTIKRGAILALLISLIFYFAADIYIKRGLVRRTKVFLTAMFISSVAIFILVSHWGQIAARLDDKGGSGRDIMYELIIDDYFSSDTFNFIFGHGINSVQKLTARELAGDSNSVGVAAHSDWLQNAYDFGLFGIVFMIFMHFQFIKLIRFLYKHRSQKFPFVLMLYVIFGLSTVYSFILSTPEAIFLALSLAYGSHERMVIIKKNSAAIAAEVKFIY